ncbi:MAG: choice-of-anchor X domain-containing protein, partial [Gammaproteobacteria bacterium]
GEHWRWLLLDNGRHADSAPGDGTYTLVLDETLQPGTQQLTVDVDGTTFRRQLRQTFQVYDSPVEALIENDGGTPVLHVIPRAGMIEPDSMEVTAVVFENGEPLDTLDVPRVTHNQWQLDLGAYETAAAYRLEVKIQGSKPGGKPLEMMAGPLHFGNASPPAAPTDDEETPATAEEDTAVTETPEATPVGGVSWFWVMVQVVLINCLLIGGLVFAYRKWLRLNVQVPKSWQQPPQEQA